MEKEKNYLPWIGIGVFLLYFIYQLYTDLPLWILGIDYTTLSLPIKVAYLLGTEFLLIVVFFLIYRKRFIHDFKDFMANFKTYIKKYIDYWAIAFALMVICNIAIVLLSPSSTATNQEAINAMFTKAPLYIIISSVIFAPIVEETVFRLSIRNMFKNDKLFILISGLVFGAVHVIGSFENWIDLIYIIPYSMPGFVFAYTLVKSKNIFVPMSLHFFHNGIMMFIQSIMMFLLMII